MFNIVQEKRLIQNKVAYEQATMFATYATFCVITPPKNRPRKSFCVVGSFNMAKIMV